MSLILPLSWDRLLEAKLYVLELSYIVRNVVLKQIGPKSEKIIKFEKFFVKF